MKPARTARRIARALMVAGAAALAAQTAAAQETSAEAEPAVDPEIVAAVKDSIAKARSFDTFGIEAELIFEEIHAGGEKIIVIEQLTASVRRPQGLHMRTSMPERERVLFFDGETVTLWGPSTRFYASVPFEGTNAEMILAAAERHGLEVPLADLFLWGIDQEDIDAITQASLIGTARIGSRVCTQYAMRQEEVDWQVWIDTAEPGLPCRYAIVDRSEPTHPLFQATVEVTPGIDTADNRFTFAPPEDAERIEFLATPEDE